VSDDLRSVVGVYDADGTLAGEVRYWFGARIGRAHCDLCDISHGTFRAKPAWQHMVQRARVPIETWHRDDAPSDVLAATGGHLAAVVAVTDGGVVPLLGPAELAALNGDVEAFARALDEAVTARGHASLFER